MMQGRYSPFEMDASEDDFEDILKDDIEEVIDLDDANNEDQVENSPKNLTLKDDTISIFFGHLFHKTVYYCSINKNGDLAATGGQDHKAFLWNVNTCEIIFDTGNSHYHSVVFAEFNYNDKYLATADLRGKIILWQMSDKTCVWKVDLWTDLMWIKWHHFSDILIASAKTGRIYMFDTRTNGFPGNEILEQDIASNAGVIFPNGKHAAIGYVNGMIQVIDLKSNAVLSTTPPDTQTRSFGHAGSICALDCYMDNNLLISVSATNQTILSTAHNGKVICVLQDLDKDGDLDEYGHNLNHVECAAFCKDPTFPVAAIGTIFNEEGTIYIWDIPKKSLRHEIQNEGGVSKLIWTRTSIFFTAGLDGKIRCFDAKAGHCLRVFSGHKEALFDFAISSDYKKAITASDDSTARIFDISSVC